MTLSKPMALLAIVGLAGGLQADFDQDIADITLLQIKEVQTELKINPSQKATLNKHADWFNAENKKLMTEAQKYASEGKQPPQSLVTKGVKLGDDMKSKVLKVLSKWQTKRLRELTLQNAGYLAVMDPNVAKKIGLSDANLKKIRTRYEETSKKAASAQQSAIKPVMDKYQNKTASTDAEKKKLQADFNKDMEAAQKKLQPQLKKFQDEWIAFVKKTLTASQLKSFEGLQGTKFKV